MRHILIMASEIFLLEHLAYLLKLTSIKVTVALDEREALELFRKEPANLIILNISESEATGLGMIRLLKRDFPEVEIIALADKRPVIEPDCTVATRTLSVHCVVQQSSAPEKLVQMIEQILHEKK